MLLTISKHQNERRKLFQSCYINFGRMYSNVNGISVK